MKQKFPKLAVERSLRREVRHSLRSSLCHSQGRKSIKHCLPRCHVTSNTHIARRSSLRLSAQPIALKAISTSPLTRRRKHDTDPGEEAASIEIPFIFGLLWSDIKYDKPPISEESLERIKKYRTRDPYYVWYMHLIFYLLFCVNPQLHCLPQRNIMIANLNGPDS